MGEGSAFRPDGPWVVDWPEVEWRVAAEVERTRLAREAEWLTSGESLPPGSRALTVSTRAVVEATRLTAEIPTLMLRSRLTGRDFRGLLYRRIASGVRRLFEELGPTHIKLGQLISSSPGLFPAYITGEFARLRDRVPAFGFKGVEATIEEDFGQPVDSLFEEIEVEPVAAASIAQVHRAKLVDGSRVVVKVQRPGVRKVVTQDIRTLAWFARFLEDRSEEVRLANLSGIVELFASTILEELDFRIEASNLLDMAETHSDLGIDDVYFPRPHQTLVSRRVMVMEELDGIAFDDTEAILESGIDAADLLKAGIGAFLESAMVGGIFHGDLHAGNVFVDSGGRYVLVDFGITGRLGARARRGFVGLIFSGARGDVRGQFVALQDLGAIPRDTDIDELISDLGADREPRDPLEIEPEELAAIMRRITEVMVRHRMRLPKDLMLLLKNLIYLDGAIARLAPDMNIVAMAEDVLLGFASRHPEVVAELAPMAAGFTPKGGLAAFGGEGVADDLPDFDWKAARRRRREIRRRILAGRRESP